MGEKIARIDTTMSVAQCAELFRGSPRALMSGAAKLQGIVARMSGGVFTADFFTPEDNGPFASLDDDRPTFAAGTWIRNGASGPNPTEVHMYVWDRGPHREVVVIAAHGLLTGTVHARRIVSSLADMFRAQDPAAQVALEG